MSSHASPVPSSASPRLCERPMNGYVRTVHAAGVPTPNGHYSHAVLHGNTLYVSGQLGRGPGMSDVEAGDIARQTRRCLEILRAILQSANSDFGSLLKMNVYIADIALWPAVNAVYSQVLGPHRPARVVIPTGALHFGALIEIDAVA